MTKPKKIDATYENWLKGTFYLYSGNELFDMLANRLKIKGITKINLLSESNIQKKELDKIKNKKRQIFNAEIEEKSGVWIKQIENDLQKSREPEKLKNRWLNTFDKLFDIENTIPQMMMNNYIEIGMIRLLVHEIVSIRDIYEKQIVEQKEYLDYILSPNMSLSIGSNQSYYNLQVKTEVYYKVDKWLKTYDIMKAENEFSELTDFDIKGKTKVILKEIWLAESKISIEDFVKKGIDMGIWNSECEIIVKKGSVYGTGKALLSSLSVALKGFAINSQVDYKVIGKVFCIAFNKVSNKDTKEPYKQFQSGTAKYIKEFKRAFSIN